MSGAVADGADPSRPRTSQEPSLSGDVTTHRQHVSISADCGAGWRRGICAADDYTNQARTHAPILDHTANVSLHYLVKYNHIFRKKSVTSLGYYLATFSILIPSGRLYVVYGLFSEIARLFFVF